MAASYPASAFIHHEPPSSPPIAGPAAVLQKPTHPSDQPPEAIELDQMTWGTTYTGPAMGTQTPKTPKTPNELEMSQPSSPKRREAADVLQSFSHPPRNRFRMASACLVSLGNGLNDGAPGALIPYLEKDYEIGYAVVSLIFIGNALGFISAAPFTDALQARWGRWRSLMIAEGIMLAGYLIIVCSPPFPVVACSFFLLGFGMAINLALGNVFCSNLHNGTAMLGAFHGSYGVGATISPLIATALVSHGARWSRFYILSIGVTAVNLFFSGWAFRGYEHERPVRLLSALERTASRRSVGEPGKTQRLKLALKNKVTLLGALFIFAYQGAEVSISGWVISFLISYRNGDPSSVGYVTAGFWAGITLGRFVLSHPAHKVGEKISVVVIVALAAIFQVLVWQVPNVIGDAVAVSIVGLLLGPVYPCAMAVFTRLIRRNVQVSALGFVSAMGSSGGAVAPFMTGLGAQSAGTWVLHPVCIGLFVVMEMCWGFLPRMSKRVE
ncbi:MAG: hypothetical protein M1833_002131 [Piccolia ochrophora]|nr:MAG: hypothetical protein M1833_002131 [Piccolia ochrophora]